MNLPGLQHRTANLGRERKGESLAVVFKSRPTSVEPMRFIPGLVLRAHSVEHRRPLPDGPQWRVSVELQATAHGALLRRIKILITDETRLEQTEGAWD